MKIMVASDIHGSKYYCNKMLVAFKKEMADKLLILGDILYHGPRNDLTQEYSPKEVIEMLNSIKNKICCVKGNCDAEVDQAVLDFPILSEYCILQVGKRMIFATHGHKFNIKNLPPMQSGDVLLHGHTHIPKCERFGNSNIYLNPGSISMPRGGSDNGYITFEDDRVEWKNLDGDVCKYMCDIK